MQNIERKMLKSKKKKLNDLKEQRKNYFAKHIA